jgi:2-succinyl-6-hydroxy-2,4-cyclohexadiene-1-carboxylate synthase
VRETLLALHGFTGSGRTWDALAAALAPDVEVVAPDLPGHGANLPDDETAYALDRTAGDLWEMLDRRGVARAHVLGYSMGGRVALRVALARPERVRSLVLVSASPGIADDAARAARVASDRALAADVERDGVPTFVDRWERLPLWESQAALPADVRDGLRAERLRCDARGLARSLRFAGAGVDAPLHDRLASLHVPTLAIAGALDAKYAAIAGELARLMPDVRAEIVEGAGHAVHLERPAELARMVGAFVRGVQRT